MNAYFEVADTGIGSTYSLVVEEEGAEVGRVGVNPGTDAHSAIAFARYKDKGHTLKLPWQAHVLLRRILQ